MEWADKEIEYEERYRAGRIANNIWRYIPQKYMDAVTDAFADSDGYWIWLDYEGGWVAYDGGSDCGMIHEYTLHDLRRAISTIHRQKN